VLLKAEKLLRESNRVAIFAHINADGDTLGSSIALKLALESMGKEVDVYCDDNINSNYDFLDVKKHYVEHDEKNYDLGIIVDCPEVNRIGKYGQLFDSTQKKLVIDHHLHNDINASVKIVDTEAGSAGIIVYRLLKQININLSKDIATALYAAISSDTGCFMFGNTTSEAHKITAELMEFNIDLNNINFFLFKRKTKEQLALFAAVINGLQFHDDNQIAISVVDQDTFKKTNTTYPDTVGLSNYLSGIDGIRVSAALTEIKTNMFIVSFRAIDIDVAEIAMEFKGGGHRLAAGCKISGKKENVVNKVLTAIRREL
jgi:phosphoesterase RecJ-like protein